MAGIDAHGVARRMPDETLVPLPYALYCIDGGMWGLLQGGTPRPILPIIWKKLKPDGEVCFQMPEQDRSDPARQERKRDELYAAIVRLCQEFGYTNEHTYECVHRTVDSISFDPFAECIKDFVEI